MKTKNTQNKKHYHFLKKAPSIKNMVNRILNADIINVYNHIDPPLKKYFSRMLCELVIFFIMVICCSIAFKSLFLFAIASIMSLILTNILLYRIIKCMEGNVCKIEGTCQEVFKPIHKILRKQLFARNYVIIQTQDQKYIKIYNIQPYKIRTNNELYIYFLQSNIKRINEDTYEICSVYYIYINKSNFYRNKRR